LVVFTRTVEIGPSEKELKLLVCELPAAGNIATLDGETFSLARRDGRWTAVSARGDGLVSLAAPTRVEARFPPGKEKRRLKLLIAHGEGDKTLPAFVKRCKASPAPEDLKALTKPAASRWQPLTTRGEVGADTHALAVDTLTVPYDNPFKALFFLTGVDALPNGDLAVCTAHGDVWLVQGVNKGLEKLTWRRFATGLYQPLGLKVVGGKVIVLERGQLTELHDLNGDGEADFYQVVSGDWHTGNGQHSFDTCLEFDGLNRWFYFFKTGDPETPTGGCLLRVSADGTKTEIFATGFRHPIGLGLSPDGVLSGADQEGNWMPATRVDLYQKGGFYGDMRTHHRKEPPKIYDPPLLWLPREADNSAGGQVWVPEGSRSCGCRARRTTRRAGKCGCRRANGGRWAARCCTCPTAAARCTW
jgi:hypothetical protein